jgi:uncharacterized protein (TIGR02271 family)
MATTLVGIFDDYSAAQRAVQELRQAGIDQGNVQIVRNDASDYAGQGTTSAGSTSSAGHSSGTGITARIGSFFDRLFGGDDAHADDRGIYSEAVRRGSTAVTVDLADESMIDRASDILEDAGAIDVDQRAAHFRATGYQNFDATQPPYTEDQRRADMERIAAGGEVALPVIEEELQIGKREVQRGKVRVHTRVTERPVEEQVRLREEHVHVERRPVDREATDADFAQMREGDVTMTERAEEAVVAKRARVVEEVVVGKEATERTETVRETVRRTDVEVDQDSGVLQGTPPSKGSRTS